MRIISGCFKGKKLLIPKDNNTRPLKDSVKESLFNIIEHSKLIKFKLNNSQILDLFSGVGTFGLECISRGSKNVTFFENYPPALEILKKNIQNLDCLDRTEIMNKDVYTLGKLNLNLQNYDCVFLDPPFKELKIQILLRIIKDKNILKKDSIILIHRDKNILDVFPEDFRNLITKFYGRSKIIFGKFD